MDGFGSPLSTGRGVLGNCSMWSLGRSRSPKSSSPTAENHETSERGMGDANFEVSEIVLFFTNEDSLKHEQKIIATTCQFVPKARHQLGEMKATIFRSRLYCESGRHQRISSSFLFCVRLMVCKKMSSFLAASSMYTKRCTGWINQS